MAVGLNLLGQWLKSRALNRTALHNVQCAVAKESPPPHSATEQHQGRAVGDMDDDGDHDDYDDDDKDELHSSLGT